VNKPSDGVERVVGNHLALFAPKLGSVGTIAGIVHVKGDATQPLDGATVSIASIGSDVTDAKGAYELQMLAGSYTVVAKKPGYTTVSLPEKVVAGQDLKLDIEMAKDPNADFDGDGVPDVSDDCPEVADPDQTDTDGDGAGDACDGDDDGDGVMDEDDDCPLMFGTGSSCRYAAVSPDIGPIAEPGEIDGCNAAPGGSNGAWLVLALLGMIRATSRRRRG